MNNFGSVIFFILILLQIYFFGSSLSAEHECLDTVPLWKNINGKIAIKPGPIVLPGTNITIICSGTDGKQGAGEPINNPKDYEIETILIFSENRALPIRRCNVKTNDKRECSLNLTTTTSKGSVAYTCRFGTKIFPLFTCFTSENLTVTDDVCSQSPCSANATCKEKYNTYTCICDHGFYQNGSICEDIKECSNSSISPCPKNAKCIETEGSFACICKTGFTGNGTQCKGLSDSNCAKQNGSSNCSCEEEFSENGTRCEEIQSGINENIMSSSSKQWTIVGTVCAIVLICATGLAFLFYKQRKKPQHETPKGAFQVERKRVTAIDNLGILFPSNDKNKFPNSPRRTLPSIEDHNKIDRNLDEEHLETDSVFSYICVLHDWEMERDNLTLCEKKLGGGQFGIVKKGVYKEKAKKNEGIPVAVKMLKEDSSANDRSDLLMELQILKEVNKQPHPNVIQLIGAIISEDPIMVITEYCSHGNLRNILQKSRVKEFGKESPEHYINVVSTLSQRILLKLATDVACGMKHLAAHQFVHRDLATRNILVNSNYEAKVSDFGLARPISEDKQMYVKSNRNLLPVKWMALESLTHGVFRTSSDIWAFGVVLWEIITLGKEPYPGISPYDVLNYVASGNRMEKPPQCSDDLYNVMLKCWDANQESRPNFTTIHEELSNMLEDKQQKRYINIIEFNDAASEISNRQSERFSGSLSDLERYTLA